jgi:rhomboid protease GluP
MVSTFVEMLYFKFERSGRMIFLRYESFREYIRFYPVTSIFLLLNIIMFILLSLDGGSTDIATLIKYGAMTNDPYFTEGYKLYVRMLSAMFLHIGFQHLLFNCFALFVFAPPMERLLGSVKYALFYIGSGLIGNLFSYMLHTDLFFGAGASGAIYGIYAAYLYLILFQKHILDMQSKKTVQVILVIGIVYTIIVPQVSLLGHLGGFLGGFALFHVLFNQIKRKT